MAQAYKEGREQGKKKKDYTVIAGVIYIVLILGHIFGAIDLNSMTIMSFVYLYFMYEYHKQPKPDTLQITYKDGEPKQSIKDLDGKTVTVKLHVTKFEPKIVTE